MAHRIYTGTWEENQAAIAADRAKDDANRAAWAAARVAAAARRAERMSTPTLAQVATRKRITPAGVQLLQLCSKMED